MNCPFRLLLLIAVFSAALLIGSSHAAIHPGDVVEVTMADTPLYHGDEAVGKIAAGVQFKAARVQGGWVAGFVTLGADAKKTTPGWVRLTKLRLIEAASSIEKATAALKALAVKLETDAEGHVVEINAAGSEIDDDDLIHVAALDESLETLDLSETKVTDRGLAYLSTLTRLEKLFLDETKVTDAGLRYLKPLVKLDVLALSGTPITGRGLANLKSLTKLRVLNLSETKINDERLVYLAPFTNLETLALVNNGLTGKGFKHLSGLTNLIVINFNKNPVIDEGLPHLAKMQRLRILRMYDTKITDKGSDALKDKIGSLAIFK
ncbi:MAG: hypothetical protein IID44_31985 [Planctomycetes bacterium]|nr:hypothetical protein [Planctomycetota bacterium]